METTTHGSASNILQVKIRDSATGGGKTGLTFNSAGLIIGTRCDNEAAATAYTQAGGTIETVTTLGTYSAPTATKCRFREMDPTSLPGWYELQFADARFAVASAKKLGITISGAAGMVQCDKMVELKRFDLQTSTVIASAIQSLTDAALAQIIKATENIDHVLHVIGGDLDDWEDSDGSPTNPFRALQPAVAACAGFGTDTTLILVTGGTDEEGYGYVTQMNPGSIIVRSNGQRALIKTPYGTAVSGAAIRVQNMRLENLHIQWTGTPGDLGYLFSSCDPTGGFNAVLMTVPTYLELVNVKAESDSDVFYLTKNLNVSGRGNDVRWKYDGFHGAGGGAGGGRTFIMTDSSFTCTGPSGYDDGLGNSAHGVMLTAEYTQLIRCPITVNAVDVNAADGDVSVEGVLGSNPAVFIDCPIIVTNTGDIPPVSISAGSNLTLINSAYDKSTATGTPVEMNAQVDLRHIRNPDTIIELPGVITGGMLK